MTKHIRNLLTCMTIAIAVMLLSLPVSAKTTAADKAKKAYDKMLKQSRIYLVPKKTIFGNEDLSSVRASELKKRFGDSLLQETTEGDEMTAVLQYSRPSDLVFSLAYIDNDNIPELIVQRPEKNYCACAWVYTFKDGKAVPVSFTKRRRVYGAMNSITGYYKKKGVFCNRFINGGEDSADSTDYLTLKKGKVNDLSISEDENGNYYVSSMEKNDEGESYVVGNPTTKADFRKRLKKLTGGGKMTKITYRANTAANRKKYLK